MTFVCQCCGDCCSTMGEIISIREQTGPFEFRVGFTNGEERVVTVDPDKTELFSNQEKSDVKALACPFLRRRGPGRRICTVHGSRPDLCRGYLCSRILILDGEGKRAGRIPSGTRTFVTGDRTLLEIWRSTFRDLSAMDDEQWEKTVDETFTRSGFRIIR